MEILGYNIALKIGGKVIEAVTQDQFSISQTIKESLTKGDKGVTKAVVTGYGCTFNTNGNINKKDGTSAGLDSDELFAQSLKKGADAEVDFVYNRGDLKAYSGKAVMTSYTEDTNADGTATWSAAWRVVSDLTETTVN